MEFNKKRNRKRNSNSDSIVLDKNYVNPLFSSTEDFTQTETDKNIEIQIKELSQEIKNIKTEIKDIRMCLESINEGMKNVAGSCNNMDRHISFIDGVYSTIRKPMEFIFNKISYISGSEQLVLEETPN